MLVPPDWPLAIQSGHPPDHAIAAYLSADSTWNLKFKNSFFQISSVPANKISAKKDEPVSSTNYAKMENTEHILISERNLLRVV